MLTPASDPTTLTSAPLTPASDPTTLTSAPMTLASELETSLDSIDNDSKICKLLEAQSVA